MRSLTIDELAAAAGTTTRSVRSFQSMGLLDPPSVRGRTGLYDERHLERLEAILSLQEQGFALRSLSVLFDALERGDSLRDVLGLGPRRLRPAREDDSAELYGFAELQESRRGRAARHLRQLSVVPTTVWEEPQAS